LALSAKNKNKNTDKKTFASLEFGFFRVQLKLAFRLRYSFICHCASTRRQLRDLFGLRVKLPPVTTSLTTQRLRQFRNSVLLKGWGNSAIPLSALPKD